MGLVTVVTSGKGGVGKSTVSVGLATLIAEKGEKVLLIDGDTGLRSLDLLLGVKEQLVYDISDVIKRNCEITESIYKCSYVNNLFLIPAPQNIDDELSPEIMKQIVSILSNYYDHVIVDCPAGVGNGFKMCIGCADRALVVANTNPLSLADSRKVRDILIELGVEDIRLVINRFSNKYFKKSDLYEDLDSVIDESGIQLIAVIPEDVYAIENLSKGLPLSKKSSIYEAFGRFSTRFLGERVPLPAVRKL